MNILSRVKGTISHNQLRYQNQPLFCQMHISYNAIKSWKPKALTLGLFLNLPQWEIKVLLAIRIAIHKPPREGLTLISIFLPTDEIRIPSCAGQLHR